MENWFRPVFLIITAACFTCSANLFAAEQTDAEEALLIQPDIKRISFDEAKIEGDDFEIQLMAGFLSLEDFGVNPVIAARLNYYIDENVFTQFTLSRSKGGETSYEVLTGGAPLLTSDERRLQYYSINIGLNILPGEAFLSENTSYNTTFYISGGIGNATFAGSDRFAINYGAGYQLLLSDRFTLSVDFRDILFNVDVFGQNKMTNNLQLMIGAGWFF